MTKRLTALLLGMMIITAGLIPGASAATDTQPPVIPEGTLYASVVEFDAGESYAVYSAPSRKSIRGAKDRARVSTNDWIQVFGSDGPYILVQYAITADHYRIGYIPKDALPENAKAAELNFLPQPAILSKDTDVTDDPLFSGETLVSLSKDTKVNTLAVMGKWTYIEADNGKKSFRGFVPSESVSNTVYQISEAAYVLTGSWRLYSGSVFGALDMTFQPDGSMTGTTVSYNGANETWRGNWSITPYDPMRHRYWNDPEFELVITRGNQVQLFGLRICKAPQKDGLTRYAMILSDGNESSGMVQFNH